MIIDAHLDLAFNVIRGRDVRMAARQQPTLDGEIATCGFPDLAAGGVGTVFGTIFCLPQSARHPGYSNPQEAYEQAVTQLDQYAAWEREGWIRVVGSGELGVGRPIAADRISGLPTPHSPLPTPIQTYILLEGAAAIRTVADVQTFYDRGVRLVGLSWQRTQYAGGTATPGPLTDAGREVVREFDRLGILHDASHLAEHAFWDLLHATDRTVIASHSNCRSIVKLDPNERHLTDAMIRAIAARGGVIGINYFDKFLLPHDELGKRRATLDDVVAHIKHVCDLTGSTDHVAIGTDLDGGLGRDQVPVEIETAADMPKLGERLATSGFTAADVEKINSGNWLRIIRQMNWE